MATDDEDDNKDKDIAFQRETPEWLKWCEENPWKLMGALVYTILVVFLTLGANSLISDYRQTKDPKTAKQADSTDLFLGQSGNAEIVVDFEDFVVKMDLESRNKTSGVYKGATFHAYLPGDGAELFTDENMRKARKAQMNEISANSFSDNQPKEEIVVPKSVGYEDISEAPRKEYITKNLKRGVKDPENKKLQKILNHLRFIVKNEGEGSPGHETDDFGPGVSSALENFKEANREEIENFGVFVASGEVLDSATRDYLNYLITTNEKYQLALK